MISCNLDHPPKVPISRYHHTGGQTKDSTYQFRVGGHKRSFCNNVQKTPFLAWSNAPSMAGSSLPFTRSLNSVLVRVWDYVKSWDKNVNLTECSPLSHSQSNQGADSLTDNESGVDLSRGWKGGWRSGKEQMTLQLSLDQMVETARLEQYSRQREHHGQRHLWESMACSGTVRDLVCPEYSACVCGGNQTWRERQGQMMKQFTL